MMANWFGKCTRSLKLFKFCTNKSACVSVTIKQSKNQSSLNKSINS